MSLPFDPQEVRHHEQENLVSFGADRCRRDPGSVTRSVERAAVHRASGLHRKRRHRRSGHQSEGSEAGVWVIAETADLRTKFVKIVVTDDDGRYVLPQLPKANYKVWARGYELVDSPPVLVTPGKIGNLNAAVAPNARAAAEYYPGIYWFSLLRVPDKSEFPG